MTTATNSHGTIAGCVGVLAEAFGRTLTTATIEAYRIGLSGLGPEQIRRATETALRTCKFMPSPAELRELSADQRIEERAVKAWQALSDAVVRNGYIRTVMFDDSGINAAVRALGGWERLCGMPAETFDVFTRKDFIAYYERLARAGVGEEAAAPLIGWFDRENALHGYSRQPVVFVVTGLPGLPGAPLLPEPRKPEMPRIDFKS